MKLKQTNETDMKELDSSVILREIDIQIDATEWSIEDILGKNIARLAVMGIYYTNDIVKGYGQDFNQYQFSVISFRTGVSVIWEGKSSSIKESFSLCGYDNLQQDIESILFMIQAAIDRIDQ